MFAPCECLKLHYIVDNTLSKGMGRVKMCVFGTAVEEGSQISCVNT
jgi:hypothetical protein